MTDIVIDFGGTNIKIGLVEDGRVLAKTSLEAHSDRGLAPQLPVVERAVAALLDANGLAGSACRGIGIAMPGVVDPDLKTVLAIGGKYDDAAGFAFDAWVSGSFGLPCIVENDAKAALCGEVAFGSARSETDAVLMIFGTGIGTAAMIGGQLVRGRHHQAGCLGGHLTTDAHGRPCACGSIGCVEAESGHWALPGIAQARPGFAQSALAKRERVDYRAIVESATGGDPFSDELLEELIVHWSAGIINLIHAYDPEVVILSGGLMKSAHLLLPRLSERVRKLAWTPWGEVRFAVAGDPDTSVLLGLSSLLQRSLS